MNYTIRASVYESEKAGENPVKGFCTLVFGDSFKVTNIAILENKSSGELFVSMPRYLSNEKDENGNQIYKDVCNPITKEFREELYTNILTVYGKTVDDPNVEMKVGADSQNSKAEPDFSVSAAGMLSSRPEFARRRKSRKKPRQSEEPRRRMNF